MWPFKGALLLGPLYLYHTIYFYWTVCLYKIFYLYKGVPQATKNTRKIIFQFVLKLPTVSKDLEEFLSDSLRIP